MTYGVQIYRQEAGKNSHIYVEVYYIGKWGEPLPMRDSQRLITFRWTSYREDSILHEGVWYGPRVSTDFSTIDAYEAVELAKQSLKWAKIAEGLPSDPAGFIISMLNRRHVCRVAYDSATHRYEAVQDTLNLTELISL